MSVLPWGKSRWLGVIVLLWCASFAPSAEKPTLIWRGCGISLNVFMDAAADAYEKETGVRIQLSGGGATLGIEAAATGGAHLGGTCRACLNDLGETKLPVKLAVVAWDALVVVVHKDNPVTDISRAKLKQVLQSEIGNWKELGGRDERIVVVARRGKTSGVGYSTRQLIFEKENADYGKGVIRLPSSGPVERLINRVPRAIAVTGISSARKRDWLKWLTIDGHEPTVENISSGKYPYFRPLYIAYRPGANPEADRFVAWLLGEKGQQVIKDQGTVNLAQGARLYSQYKKFEEPDQIVNYDMLRELDEKATMK